MVPKSAKPLKAKLAKNMTTKKQKLKAMERRLATRKKNHKNSKKSSNQKKITKIAKNRQIRKKSQKSQEIVKSEQKPIN